MCSERVKSVVRATSRRARGFTLVEMLIVMVALGVLSAIVLPRFSDASHIARANTLKDELRYLRTQVAMFKAQHEGVAPGYPKGNTQAIPTAEDFRQQMTSASDARCNMGEPSPAYQFGPYLQKMPQNPLNGLDTVWVVPNDQPAAKAVKPDDSTGWIYRPQTLEIIPNSSGVDADGTRYIDY
ncbi:MAG TPA: type II secretion system protein [Tepidisphaeraceae bacterium]|nr:type II secretion system protein [Tepidisphaeraceae bacterium]